MWYLGFKKKDKVTGNKYMSSLRLFYVCLYSEQNKWEYLYYLLSTTAITSLTSFSPYTLLYQDITVLIVHY